MSRVERQIDITPRGFEVTFYFDSEVVKSIKEALPEREYSDTPHKAWYVPAKPEYVGRIVWFADKHKFRFTDTADAFINKVLMEELTEQRNNTEIPKLTLSKIKHKPFPFQLEDINFCLQNDRVLIGNPTGLGKTMEALLTVEARKAYPCVVVVPGSQTYKWEEEVRKWIPNRPVLVLDATAHGMALYADIYIVSYDSIQKWQKQLRLMEPEGFIFDELHKAKNPDSRRNRTISDILRNTNPRTRLGLTATPVINKAEELLVELNLLGCINWFGGFWNFAFRYCNAQFRYGRYEFPGFDPTIPEEKELGKKRIAELHERLKAICYIRHPKELVMPQLPSALVSVVPLDISNRSEYDDAESDLLDWLQRDKRNQNNAPVQLARYQILKHIAAHGKMDGIKSWVDDFLDNDEKLLLFAHHKDIQKQLREWYPDAAHLTGGQSKRSIKANQERFQTDHECRIAICSDAAIEGHDLFAASTIGIVEMGWTAAHMDQLIGRAHRYGQTRNVSVNVFVGRHTIDHVLAGIIDRKRVLMTSISEGDDDETAAKELTKALLSQKIRQALAA